TALKPAAEHWILCRKPLEGTVAANVLEHGTGALNIDGCRIPMSAADAEAIERPNGFLRGGYARNSDTPAHMMQGTPLATPAVAHSLGRWPANLTLSEEAAALLDEQSGELISPKSYVRSAAAPTGLYGGSIGAKALSSTQEGFGDSGGASRFFYVAKPDRS